MCTRVNDSIHVQIQVIEFNAVWVGGRSVDRNFNAIDVFGLWVTDSFIQLLISDLRLNLQSGSIIQAHLVFDTMHDDRRVLFR